MKDRSRIWDLAMIVLLLGSIALVFVYEGVDPDRTVLRSTLVWVDLALVVFFVLEWVWRVRSFPGDSRRYALRNSWELLGMIPIILPVPAFLRALRFLRVVRILRAFKVLGNTLHFWERVAAEPNLKKVGVAAVAITIGGALLVWAFERGSGSGVDSFRQAIWWAIVTVTTVGYGDVTPETTMGRFIAVLLMITGIGVIGTLASTMASVLLADRSQEDAEDAMIEDAPASIAGQLAMLASLHEEGKIDDEEFKAAKRQVIDRA